VVYEIQLAERTLKSYRVNPKDKAVFEHGQEVSVTFNVDDVVIVRMTESGELQSTRRNLKSINRASDARK